MPEARLDVRAGPAGILAWVHPVFQNRKRAGGDPPPPRARLQPRLPRGDRDMKRLVLALAVVLSPGIARAQAPAAAGGCDRACLVGFVDQYLDALVAQDPKRLPVAANVKFTENGQRPNPRGGFPNPVDG